MTTAVYLENGPKKVFACARDWPGWCRSGKTEELALAAFADYLPRYAEVAATAGVELPADTADDVEIVERVAGNATTDFGAPGVVPVLDSEPTDAATAQRHAALVVASWRVFDTVVAGAPAALRKGPRGGGRDRDKIVEHVLAAEAAYLRKVGLKVRQPALGDTEAVEAVRAQAAEVLGQPSSGAPDTGWPLPYAARRMAWHVLDHAWEIEDRSDG